MKERRSGAATGKCSSNPSEATVREGEKPRAILQSKMQHFSEKRRKKGAGGGGSDKRTAVEHKAPGEGGFNLAGERAL